jgi:hypothetical protein
MPLKRNFIFWTYLLVLTSAFYGCNPETGRNDIPNPTPQSLAKNEPKEESQKQRRDKELEKRKEELEESKKNARRQKALADQAQKRFGLYPKNWRVF